LIVSLAINSSQTAHLRVTDFSFADKKPPPVGAPAMARKMLNVAREP
jgi:hypothetical protein